MDFLIQVRWTNGASPLLQRGGGGNAISHTPTAHNVAGTSSTAPTIEVTGDGGVPALNQNWSDSGVDFPVANPQKTISVSIAFNPTIAGVTAEVLSANQTYTVSGGDLVESTATVGPTGSTTSVTKHPLITGTKQSSSTAAQTVFTVNVNTAFVDVTQHWQKILGPKTTCMTEPLSCWAAYTKLHEAGTELVVLGLTAPSPSPLVWFVVVPDASKSADTVSSLVFFRPSSPAHSTLEDATNAMFALTRYLLRPRSEDPSIWWAWDVYHNITAAQLATVNIPPGTVSQSYDWLCAGFENALKNSGKKVILVYPLPNGTDFGIAQSSGLATPLANIRALLHARGKIGAGQPSVGGNKVALAGYSAGGLGLFTCLSNNTALVNEVYTFDPNGLSGKATALSDWAFATSDFRLRLACGRGDVVTDSAAVATTVNARIADPSRKATGGEVTTHPASPSTFYQPAASGGNAWWNHVFLKFPATLTNTDANSTSYVRGTRHQFVIYGGEDPAFAPATSPNQPWTGATFLQQFLSLPNCTL
jgi:hypothetical protein